MIKNDIKWHQKKQEKDAKQNQAAIAHYLSWEQKQLQYNSKFCY